VPSAIRHDHELSGRGLATLLVEAQGADAAQLEAFMWKTFPDNDCFVSTGVFLPLPESRGIPHGGVVGVDGKLLWAGNPLGDTKKVAELIEQELTKVKKGWGDTAEAKKVRAALYGKGDLAGAWALVAALPDGDEKTMLQAEVDARYATAKAAIDKLKGDGRWTQAQTKANELSKAVGTKAEWVAEVGPIVAGFAGPAAQAELALEKKFDKVLKAMREKKGDNAPKQLEALVKSAGETKVGVRIQRTLTALRTPLHGE
jgi:hypothetical protein